MNHPRVTIPILMVSPDCQPELKTLKRCLTEVETFSPQPEDRKSYALSEVFSTLSDSDDEQIFSPYVVPKRDPVLFRVKTKALRPKVVRPAAVSQKSISVAIEGGREQEDFSHAIKLFRDSEEAFSSIEPDGDATPSLTSSPSTHVEHSFRPESPDQEAFDVPRFEIFLDRNPMAYEIITHFLRNSRLPLSLDVSRLSEKSDWKLDASFLLNTYLTLQEVKEEAKMAWNACVASSLL
ncbi:hypothetical protein BT69DRAFT_1080532 [Atractiella rhizophila]|nr:hypothetical protein BT69DRAFT_1080532 [Atractiella rhizophila]